MSQQLIGIYRQGHIELGENHPHLPDETPVLVTLSHLQDIPLDTQAITQQQAQQLRHSLASFAEEWDSPEMTIYDNYDEVKFNT
ncbi:MAG: hypothetical protein ACRC6M_15580 [Microcystaceae cyanobacterium]